MAVLISIVSLDDRLHAIDILVDAEETYHRVPKGCFLVSNRAAQLLTEQDIPFQVVSKPAGEE